VDPWLRAAEQPSYVAVGTGQDDDVAIGRISAPVAAVAISGGFFGIAFVSAFRWLLYFGGRSLLVALILTGVGLLRNLRTPEIKT
jgi:hypothetical protein